jgi:hypothetical protein
MRGDGQQEPRPLGMHDLDDPAQQYASQNFSAQRGRVEPSGTMGEWKAPSIRCMATSIGC